MWAGDVLSISFENNNIPLDWDNGGTYGTVNYNEYLSSEDGIYSKQTYNYSAITSQEKYKIESGQKIVLMASLYPSASTYPYLEVYYSTDGSKWNKLNQWTSFTYGVFSECTINITDNKLEDGCYLQIRDKKVKIKSFEIQSAAPELTTIDEEVDPEVFKSTTVASLKVKYTSVSGWNSICMPFSLKGYSSESEYLSAIFGTGWKTYQLTSYEDGVITFSERTSFSYNMVANRPYLVYTVDPQPVPVGGFEFESVDVTYSSDPKSTVGTVTFQGTYAPISKGSFPDNSYGVTSEGRIVNAGSNSSMKGYRAYFNGEDLAGARMFILEVDDEATDLGFVKMVDTEAKEVYNLKGQRVQKGSKGLYVVNGKKVVIK